MENKSYLVPDFFFFKVCVQTNGHKRLLIHALIDDDADLPCGRNEGGGVNAGSPLSASGLMNTEIPAFLTDTDRNYSAVAL